MASFIKINYVDSACNGCLSSDRKLSPVVDDKIRNVFHDILFADNLTRNLWCYECRAVIEKVVKFKNQVKEAQNILSKYTAPEKYLSTFSRLSQHLNNNIIQIIPNDSGNNNKIYLQLQNDDEEKYIITTDHGTKTTSNDVKVNSEENLGDGEEKIEVCDDIKPQFVKVENVDDESYIEEIQIAEGNVIESGSLEEFDDSDNEPLKLKKSKKEKKRKKTEVTIAVKNYKTKKAERPSGVVNSTRVAKKLKQLNISEDSLQMILLSWEQVEEERQKMLHNDTFTRHQYRCYGCAIGFNHRVKLDNHMVKHDKKSGSVYCNICTVRCKDDHALTAHKRRHRVRWRCCVCGALWSRLAVAMDHLNRSHRTVLLHTCTICGDTLQTLAKLRNHMKNHSERQKCELCGKTFRDRTSLKTHLFIHNGEKEFSCPKCDKKFLFKRRMEIHMVTHEKSELLYCHECDKNFKNKMSFYQHMKYNLKHIDPEKLKHACKLCDKKFLKAARLEEHNAAIHLKITPIKCVMEGCNFACSSRPRLRSHIRLVHRNIKAKRDHVCHSCGKAYTTRKCLEGHLRSHSGARPFSCLLCAAAFGYPSALYNHHRLLHKEKPRGRPTTEERTWRLVNNLQNVQQT